MIAYRTFTEAFAHFGARSPGPRNCWSAASPDGSTLVLAFWNAKRQWDGSTQDIMGLDQASDGALLPWTASRGNMIRKRHIELALAGDRRVRAVLVEPTNPDAGRFESLVRKSSAPIAVLDGWFQIADYNSATGAFRAERIG